MQPAATLWYHPHLMGKTEEQVLRGLVGLFILDDTNPVGAALPHTYGVDDIPLILQDEQFGANGQLNIGGWRWRRAWGSWGSWAQQYANPGQWRNHTDSDHQPDPVALSASECFQ